MATKHILWSNEIHINDWKDDILAENPKATVNEIYEEASRINDTYLDDLRYEFNKKLDEQIIIIAKLGLWNGVKSGYKILSNNLKDCFYSDTENTEWYVDGYNDLRCVGGHHDGTNHYLYRVFKPNISETTKNNFLEKIYNDTVTRQDITRCTIGLGKIFADHYGW